MAVDIAAVRAFAPQFTSTPDSVITVWLGVATSSLSVGVFQARLDEAVLLWTCHKLQLTPTSKGNTGLMSSKKVGDVQVDFATAMPSGVNAFSDLGMTVYGRQLNQLIMSRGIGAFTV